MVAKSFEMRYTRGMNLGPRASQLPIVYPIEIILASQSIGRKTLLEKLGVRFRVIVTHVDEGTIVDKDPLTTLLRRARTKADEVIKHPRVYHLSEPAQSLVIAADSMAISGRQTFGKANDREDAKTILKALMGKTHTFATAVSLVLVDKEQEKKRWEKVMETRVTMRKLRPAELEGYVARYDFTRFAAGYALNETPWSLVTKIDGSYTNVIGLPFEVLLPILRSLKIIV